MAYRGVSRQRALELAGEGVRMVEGMWRGEYALVYLVQHHQVADVLPLLQLAAEELCCGVAMLDVLVGLHCPLLEERRDGLRVIDVGHGGGGQEQEAVMRQHQAAGRRMR